MEQSDIKRRSNMDISYLDLFLAFLGTTLSMVSALPGLFFRPRKVRVAQTPNRQRAIVRGSSSID
jgi:hypothetical protein